MNRREFLANVARTSIALGAGVNFQGIVSGCMQMIKEESPVIYPPLKTNKIQPPNDGCYFGLHYFLNTDPDYHAREFGVDPKIYMEQIWYHGGRFKKDVALKMIDSGAYPFFYRQLTDSYAGMTGFWDLMSNQNFRKNLDKYAKDAADFKQPFFISTMRNPNGPAFPWCGNPSNFKKMWKLMWQIFEDNGANEYATWVWQVGTPEMYCGNSINPNRYYPGDEFVDWVGLMVYARSIISCSDISFSSSAYPTYYQIRKKHPDKPIMMAEIGRSKGSAQPGWVEKAFRTIRNCPGMKAAIYWNTFDVDLGDDSNLSHESYAVLKEVLKDPYFICGNLR